MDKMTDSLANAVVCVFFCSNKPTAVLERRAHRGHAALRERRRPALHAGGAADRRHQGHRLWV